jgi:homoserine O-acetyltransferase
VPSTDIEWLVDGHCLDPSRYFLVIPNMLTNGCPRRRQHAGLSEVTTYDNVMLQRQMLVERSASTG